MYHICNELHQHDIRTDLKEDLVSYHIYLFKVDNHRKRKKYSRSSLLLLNTFRKRGLERTIFVREEVDHVRIVKHTWWQYHKWCLKDQRNKVGYKVRGDSCI